MFLSCGLFHLWYVFFFFFKINRTEPECCTAPCVDRFPPLHKGGAVRDEGKANKESNLIYFNHDRKMTAC